jgi:hypothetical protein
MGQPIGFDFSLINCDVGEEVVTVDGSVLDGWEFQILTANIDSHKKTNIAKHLLSYLVVVAVFRAENDTRFVWPQTQQEMNFVAFYDVSQIIQDVPRLGDYDDIGALPMPPIDQIPLSTKSSQQSFETITLPSSTTKAHAYATSYSHSHSQSQSLTPSKLHPLTKQPTSTSST